MTTTHALAAAKPDSTSVAAHSGKAWQERLGSALGALDAWTAARKAHNGDLKPTAEVRRDLPSILETMEIACRPLDDRAFAIAFVQFMDTAIALGIARAGASKEEVAAQLDVYREALGDLPGDLLLWALRATWKEWRYASLPKPGDVYDLIRAKVSRRRDALRDALWGRRLSDRFGLPVGLLAAPEVVVPGVGRTLSPEVQAMIDEAKKPKRYSGGAGLKPDPAERTDRRGGLLVEPRPDLVSRWAAEMGVAAE